MYLALEQIHIETLYNFPKELDENRLKKIIIEAFESSLADSDNHVK